MTLEKDRHLNYHFTETISRRQRRPIDLIFRHGLGSGYGWAELGIVWLFQRDLNFMEQNPSETTSVSENIRPVPIYDAVQAVISVS